MHVNWMKGVLGYKFRSCRMSAIWNDTDQGLSMIEWSFYGTNNCSHTVLMAITLTCQPTTYAAAAQGLPEKPASSHITKITCQIPY